MGTDRNDAMRKYRENHREEYNAYQREWRRKYYREHRDHVLQIDKISRIKRELKREKEKTMNKTQQVLTHLKDKGSITSWEAITLYRATRLSDIIYRLRSQGHNIISVEAEHTNKEGDSTHFARYILRKDNTK